IASLLVTSSLASLRSCRCRIIDVSVDNVIADGVINRCYDLFVAIFFNVIFGVGLL
ncbi:26784_t:CDS:1, partial [Gigaspora margarita]